MKFYEIAPSLKHLRNLKDSVKSRSPALGSKHPKPLPDEASTSRESVHDVDASKETILEVEELYTSIYDLPSFRAAYADFRQHYPKYSLTLHADDLREEEYSHLQETGNIFLDFHGLGLFSFMQRWLDEKSCLFRLSFISANLHDHALHGAAVPGTIEFDLRRRIFEYLNVREDEYSMVFTASHASAFKLLGEAFPFTSCPRLLSVYDHENESLDKLIQGAKSKNAKIMCASFRCPSMRICSTNLKKLLLTKKRKREKARGLFAFPTQSEVTGTKYSYQWMTLAEKCKWKVLLDTSALGPKDLDSLGLSLFRPDFMVVPFYKIFGFDRSGFACFFIKKSSLQILEKSSSGRNLGMVRIVPLPEEDFTDQEDEFRGDKSESPSQTKAEKDNIDLPIVGRPHEEGRGQELGAYEDLHMQPYISRTGPMETEKESLALCSTVKPSLTEASLEAEAKGAMANNHISFKENDVIIENWTASSDEKKLQTSIWESKANSAIPVVEDEARVGMGPPTEALDRQTLSINYTTQAQTVNSLANSPSQSRLDMYHNSSSHSQSNFEPDVTESKEGYWHSSTLASWKSIDANHLDSDFEFIHALRVPLYQQQSFSFRQDVRTSKSVQQVSPKLSETSVSNLAFESEPETRSTADSDNDVELQGTSLSDPPSYYARSPKELEEEIQEEHHDKVEESFHKRIGRDDGLIDSRKVDYFPSPLMEDGEDDLGLNTNSGLFVYRKRGALGYMEPLPDDMYARDSSGSEYSEEEDEEDDGGKHPQVICRTLDHADSLGLTKVNIRMKSLIDWLVESFSKLLHARHESPHPLVEIIGPKVKFDRGAFVGFNLVDCTGMLLHPSFVQRVAEKGNIFLQLGFVSNFYTDKVQGVFNPFVVKTNAAPQPSGFPVLTAALSFLSNFEDVYRLWMFVSKFLDPDFVAQEKLNYDVSDQHATP